MTYSLKTSEDYLKLPYSRVLIPEEEGGYSAQILEFPGCFAEGETPSETYENLENAALGWIQSMLDLGRTIPEPREFQQHSGRILVRLPKSLHRKVAEFAKSDGTSINQFVVAALSQEVGYKKAANK